MLNPRKNITGDTIRTQFDDQAVVRNSIKGFGKVKKNNIYSTSMFVIMIYPNVDTLQEVRSAGEAFPEAMLMTGDEMICIYMIYNGLTDHTLLSLDEMTGLRDGACIGDLITPRLLLKR